MLIQYFPKFCGGQILYGLYNCYNANEEVKKNIVDTSINEHKVHYNKVATGVDDKGNAVYAPNDLADFAYVLYKQTLTTHVVGVIFAVTNTVQEQAAENLEALGFVEVADTNKYSEGAGCKSWVGDWHRVVKHRVKEEAVKSKHNPDKPAQSVFSLKPVVETPPPPPAPVAVPMTPVAKKAVKRVAKAPTSKEVAKVRTTLRKAKVKKV